MRSFSELTRSFAKGGTKRVCPGTKGGGKKYAHVLALALVVVLAFTFSVDAQQVAPFQVVGAGTAGFSKLSAGIKDAGGGFQLGTLVQLPGSDNLFVQALATKVGTGSDVHLRKFSTNALYNFEVTDGFKLYLMFGLENNMGGSTGPDPSTDVATGFGGVFRLKTFTNPAKWTRAPAIDLFAQIQFVDGDKPSEAAPNAPGSYQEISVGLNFSPGDFLKAVK